MKYSLNDKIAYYNRLLNPEFASQDLKLLQQVAPAKRLDSSWLRNPCRFANKILYMLLDFASPEEICRFRHPEVKPDGTGKTELGNEKPNAGNGIPTGEREKLESENEQLKDELSDKEDELEETKVALQEAEERADEAEERAAQAEEELDAEKKKDR